MARPSAWSLTIHGMRDTRNATFICLMAALSSSQWKWPRSSERHSGSSADVRGAVAMNLWQDFRFATRLLIKDRWFTAVAAVALALGIGVNTPVFTLVKALLIRWLPFDEPDRIVSLGTIDARGRTLGISRMDLEDWRSASHSYTGLAAFLGAPANLSEEGRPAEQFGGNYQSFNAFQLIGQRPVLGRDFTAQDDRVEAPPVVIIGHNVWKN